MLYEFPSCFVIWVDRPREKKLNIQRKWKWDKRMDRAMYKHRHPHIPQPLTRYIRKAYATLTPPPPRNNRSHVNTHAYTKNLIRPTARASSSFLSFFSDTKLWRAILAIKIHYDYLQNILCQLSTCRATYNCA